MRIFMLLLLTFFLTIVKKKAFLTKIKTFSYRTNIHKVPLKSIHLSAHVSIYRSLPLDGALAKMCLKIGTPARRTEDRMRSNSGFASAHGPSIFIFNVRRANANESGASVKKSPIVITYAIINLESIISSIHAAIPCAETVVAKDDVLFSLVRHCLRNGMDIVNAPTANNAHANASKTVFKRLAIKLALKIADTRLTPSKALPKLVLSAR